ncbi:MAG: hypothetical protein ABIJ17_00720 [Patescibacteria group bacterium]
MSLWRPFCYKEYNKAWLKITGNLTEKEKTAIKKFETILQKEYKSLFELIFDENKVPRDKKIQEIFEITEKKFQKVWNSIKNDLPKAKSDLSNLIENNIETIKKIINKLKIFYNVNKIYKNTKIHIILLPKTIKSGGGKFIFKNNIILEGNAERFNKLRTLEILLHEMIHLYFEDYLEKVLYPKFFKQIEYHPLKEIIASSFLPEGCLSCRFFNMSLKQSTKNFQLIKLAEKYIKSKKAIDDYFIKQCIKLYKKSGSSF